MINPIAGWATLIGLLILSYVCTCKFGHAVNQRGDRDGHQLRTVWIIRYSLLAAAVNVLSILAMDFLVAPSTLLTVMCWALAGQAVGISFGLLRVRGKVIKFYRQGDKWGEWSNFADYPITEDDITWPTSEHRFQAKKFTGTDEPHSTAIRLVATPKEAAAFGRDRSHKLRPDWDMPANVEYTGDNVNLRGDWQRFCSTPMLVKDYSMLEAVRMKVRQYKDLRSELLATGDAVFIEHTKNDKYWADGGDGKGLNMLGKIIMIVREEERRRDRGE